MAFKVPEEYRLKFHPIYGAMDASWGNNGAFQIASPVCGNRLRVIASDGGGWEHVSVSIEESSDTPTWQEMAHIKDLFWGAEDAVMQLHPPKDSYVNNHHGCLHLWRPIGQEIPLPPMVMVGDKNLTPEQVEAMGNDGRRAMVLEAYEKVFGAKPSGAYLGYPGRPTPPLRFTRPNIRNGRGSR